MPSVPGGGGIDLSRLPTLAQLEAMSTDELDQLFGLKPKVDIPTSAQRSLARVGVIDPAEGGLPVFSLAGQHLLKRYLLNSSKHREATNAG